MDTYRLCALLRVPDVSHLFERGRGPAMDIRMRRKRRKAITIMLAAAVIFASLPLTGIPAFTAEAASVKASGKVSENGVNLRAAASTSSDVVATLKRNRKLTIRCEIFTKDKSSKAVNRWYYVSAGKKKGYIRSDLVKDISWSDASAVAAEPLNYRKGPSTSFKVYGTADTGTVLTLLVPAKLSGSSMEWFRAKVNGRTAYVCSDYIKYGDSLFIMKSAEELAEKSELARALLSNPTLGGKQRVVYTFSTDNCSARFPIEGYSNAIVPQGFTYTGSKYYILYGMSAGQSIVTYSADGERLGASKFSFWIGHPNGITWDPVTRRCYIFKGNQKRIYTWNPATKKFGKSKTPYSSSGVGYDNETGLIYASSHTGIRAYSADGKFSHKKLFPRCKPGIFHYIQDCGAGEGFIFHGISGKNKKKTNYLDIYRAADNAYLGSIRITIGEYESAVIGPDGYLELLLNTEDMTDYVWRTPLNINELK